MTILTPEQIAGYRRDGYVVLADAVSPELVSRARQALAAIVEGASKVAANDAVFDLEDSHTPEHPRVRRIKAPHKLHPVFMEIVRAPRVLGAVADLVGPDVRFLNSKLNLKSAGYGAAVEWHQDWAYYPHTNDDVLAVGVMLDDITTENGPMLVVPGSHRGPVHDHHAEGRFCGGIDLVKSRVDVSAAAPMLGHAGSISLHHVRAVHGSDLNRSGADRRFLLYELAAADAWPLVGPYAHFSDFEEFNSRLLCGAPTNLPRMAAVPVRMPLPRALDPSSLYASQKALEHRAFAVAQG
jgi:ectoine hydroxylase-related dioxygenase (phytanoyl-CoA dioxygenase family)